MFRDINNGDMAYYHTRKWFNLAGRQDRVESRPLCPPDRGHYDVHT